MGGFQLLRCGVLKSGHAEDPDRTTPLYGSLADRYSDHDRGVDLLAGLAARIGSDRSNSSASGCVFQRAVRYGTRAVVDQVCDTGRREPPDGLAIASRGVLGLLTQRRGALVRSEGHIQRYDAFHGHSIDSSDIHHSIPADRTMPNSLHLRLAMQSTGSVPA